MLQLHAAQVRTAQKVHSMLWHAKENRKSQDSKAPTAAVLRTAGEVYVLQHATACCSMLQEHGSAGTGTPKLSK